MQRYGFKIGTVRGQIRAEDDEACLKKISGHLNEALIKQEFADDIEEAILVTGSIWMIGSGEPVIIIEVTTKEVKFLPPKGVTIQ